MIYLSIRTKKNRLLAAVVNALAGMKEPPRSNSMRLLLGRLAAYSVIWWTRWKNLDGWKKALCLAHSLKFVRRLVCR